ncbi:hypothetical protein KZC51_10635 [Microbacterium sp. SSW1-49]|uniref:Uncharacterized protein n=1 Tax=Microbacterium croceum TaxID=2851645 RepID=A0ABT0FEV3_9MICO|nr:hypothetical protein [Microbacterium croceum]MCK2036592.1 hypothetical protein [Microbacterium croceum]
MSLSFEEFRERLSTPGGAAALGLALSDDEGRRVRTDDSASRAWYDYWASTTVPSGPDATPGATAAPTASETTASGHGAGGHDLSALRAAPAAFPAAAPFDPGAPAPAAPPARKSRTGLWVLLSILGALVLIAVVVLVVALTTARHWTKVDVPEQPETFHSEEYETGRFDVAMDDVNLCFVDQAWSDCIDAMTSEYDAVCADIELTEAATRVCDEYLAAIDDMRSQGTDGVVASLGTFGNLSRTAELATRQVSNEDYRPAETHEAVCYLGFLGECR